MQGCLSSQQADGARQRKPVSHSKLLAVRQTFHMTAAACMQLNLRGDHRRIGSPRESASQQSPPSYQLALQGTDMQKAHLQGLGAGAALAEAQGMAAERRGGGEHGQVQAAARACIVGRSIKRRAVAAGQVRGGAVQVGRRVIALHLSPRCSRLGGAGAEGRLHCCQRCRVRLQHQQLPLVSGDTEIADMQAAKLCTLDGMRKLAAKVKVLVTLLTAYLSLGFWRGGEGSCDGSRDGSRQALI